MLVATSCGDRNNTQNSDLSHIFTPDGRTDLTTTAQSTPWSAIGRIEDAAGTWCTGTLIAEDLVLTNAHCVLDDAGNLYPDITFCPRFEGTCIHKSHAAHTWWGTTQPQTQRAGDWAIIRLKSPLGRIYGWVPLFLQANDLPTGFSWTLASYATDWANGSRLSLQSGCGITGQEFGYYLHDCDMTAGASGAPFLHEVGESQFVIAAINAAEYCVPGRVCESLHGVAYERDIANLAVKVSTFSNMLTQIPRSAADAATTLHLCNNTSVDTIYAAISYTLDQEVTEGWFPITQTSCREIDLPNGYSGNVWIRGERGQQEWTGLTTRELCVDRFRPFRLEQSSPECLNPGPNQRMVRFGARLSVKSAKVNSWTFR